MSHPEPEVQRPAVHLSAAMDSSLPEQPSTQDDLTSLAPAVAGPPDALPTIPGCESLQILGRGGMGVVYLARQAHLGRTVAVKMIVGGVHASPEARHRFLQEAGVIARIRHPHVVQIFEFGTHGNSPYYLMEYVSGGSLAERLAGTPLPPLDAAALLAKVADGVQAAHEQGVIHRDLKPANILMSFCRAPEARASEDKEARAFGARLNEVIPKITDFGLAKQPGSDLTATGALLGTPSYMAPEQAAGEGQKIDTRTDVYSLGAILYECLTGRPPFRGTTAFDTIEQTLHAEPVQPLLLQPMTPSDLNTICLKCLQKAPDQRYASAAALAVDLRNFLAGQPITARPVGRLERAWRWCRRNPVVAGLLTTVFLVLAASSAVAWGLAGWALAEKGRADTQTVLATENAAAAEERAREAEANLATAKKAVDDCFLIAKNHEAFQGNHLRQQRQLLLQAALPFYQLFRQRRSDDPAVLKEQADNFLKVGDIENEIGRKQTAHQAFQEAQQLFAQLTAGHPQDESYRHGLARAWNSLGQTRRELGQTLKAQEAFTQARQLLEPLAVAHPDMLEYQRDLGGNCHNLALIHADQGQWREALAAYQKAKAFRTKLAEANPKIADFRFDLARTCFNLGMVHRALGQNQEALAAYQQAKTLREKLTVTHPQMTDYKADLGDSWHALGTLQRDLGQLPEALASFTQAKNLQAQLATAQPQVHDYRHRLARTWISLGRLHDQRDLAAALAAYTQAKTLFAQLATEQPRVPVYRRDLAYVWNNLGKHHFDRKQWDEARAAYQEAQKLQEALVAEDPQVPGYQADLATTWNNLGGLYFVQRRLTEAQAAFERAKNVQERLLATQPQVLENLVDLGSTCCNLGHVLSDRKRPDDAQAMYLQAMKHLGGVLAQEPRHAYARLFLRNAHCGRAEMLMKLKRYPEAAADWAKAVELDSGGMRRVFRRQQALCHVRNGEAAPAVALAEAVARETNLSGVELVELARVHALIAALLKETSQSEPHAARAEALLQQAQAKGASVSPKLRDDPDFVVLKGRPAFDELTDKP